MDCLVTKLKGVSSNNTLPKFNIISGKLKMQESGAYNFITIKSGESVTVNITSGNLFFDGNSQTKTWVGTGNPQYFQLVGSGEGTVEIINPWAILRTNPTLFGVDIESFRFNDSVTSIDVGANSETPPSLWFGDLGVLGGCVSLVTVGVNFSSVGGDIVALADSLFANGKRTGTLAIYCQGSQVTFQGESTAGKTITFSQNGWSI